MNNFILRMFDLGVVHDLWNSTIAGGKKGVNQGERKFGSGYLPSKRQCPPPPPYPSIRYSRGVSMSPCGTPHIETRGATTSLPSPGPGMEWD